MIIFTILKNKIYKKNKMNARCIFILFSIFFKQWSIDEITLLKNEIKNYFSSYINIILLGYGIFSFYFIYFVAFVSFINCGFTKACYMSNMPIIIFFISLISIPLQILVINPYIKTFVYNILNLLYYSWFNKVKCE